MWDALGGHLKDSESVTEALIREVSEEIQVTPTEFPCLRALREPRPDINGNATYHLFAFTRCDGGEPVARGGEHSEVRWFPIREAALLPLAHPDYRSLLGKLADLAHP